MGGVGALAANSSELTKAPAPLQASWWGLQIGTGPPSRAHTSVTSLALGVGLGSGTLGHTPVSSPPSPHPHCQPSHSVHRQA